MPTPVSLHVGTDKQVTVALRDQDNDAVTTFTSADTPYAEVSSGGNLPVLWVPQTAWIDPTKGTFSIYLSASDTAQYDAGKYVIYNGILTATNQRIAAPNLDLTLTPSPSTSGVVPLTDVTYRDLLVYAPWLENEDSSDQNSAGFLNERGLARSWLVSILLDWYSAWWSRRRISQGWFHGAPSVGGMATLLGDGISLLVDSRLKEIECRKAIALICGTNITPGGKPSDNQYQDVADSMNRIANILTDGLVVRVTQGGVDLSFDSIGVFNHKGYHI